MTELERFFAKVQSTPALKQQIEGVPRNPEAFTEAVLKIAAANGFQVTAADLEQRAPLSDSDLSRVSGGLLIGGGAKQQAKTFADYWYQIFSTLDPDCLIAARALPVLIASVTG